MIVVHDGTEEVERVGYGELLARARGVATHLAAQGLRGERALLLASTEVDFVSTFLGCLYAGVVAVPLPPPRANRGGERFLSVARDAGATALLTTSRAGAAPEGLEGLRTVLTDLAPPAAEGDPIGGPPPEADDLFMLQYTSGSTGRPRGVRLTHGNLVSNQESIRRACRSGGGFRVVSWLPLYHDMGLFGGLLHALFVGGTSILVPTLEFIQRPVRWLRAISTFRAAGSVAPNFAYDLCTERITAEQKERLDLGCWQHAFNGAERISADSLDRFTAAFEACGFRREAFLVCYGLAEATLFVSGAGDGTAPTVRELAEDWVGPAAPGPTVGPRVVGCGPVAEEFRLEIVDPETGSLCPPGRVGEIWLAGPSVAGGYWRPSPLGEDPFDAWLGGAGGAPEGPFLRTGDLGALIDGELFVVGRIKELIIADGRNLCPQDVEHTVEASHPAIEAGAAAAFALLLDDREVLVLMIELAPRRWRELEDARALFTAVRAAVADVHELSVARIVLVRRGTMPRTTSGKIRRLACARRVAAGGIDPLADWSRPASRARAEVAVSVPG